MFEGMSACPERLTDRPKKALELARRFAADRNHVLVTPTMVLAGVAAEGECLAAQALADAGLDAAAIVETTVKLPAWNGLPGWGPSMCRMLGDADRIGDSFGVRYTNCEHLTLALLSEGAPATFTVVSLGADLPALRAEMNELASR